MFPLIDGERGPDLPWKLLFGSGGETHSGSLWTANLSDLQRGDLESAEVLTLPTTHKGIIAPPAMADLDNDQSLDVVVATFDGRLIALSPQSGETLWSITIPNSEPKFHRLSGDSMRMIYLTSLSPSVGGLIRNGPRPSYSLSMAQTVMFF